MSLLAPIYSQLANLASLLTSARASKLDNIDATISSRAPASTALSTATWTNTRAAKLDDIDVTVSSRAPASTALSTATWTNARAAKLDNIGGSVIKSIQTGFFSGGFTNSGGASGTEDYDYLDVTISSVNTSKSIVLMQYMAGGGNAIIGGRLLSSTLLRLSTTVNFASTKAGRWTVVEFY